MSDVEQFIQESNVDDRVANDLRSAQPQTQQLVLAEGPLVSARNPSAVLACRLRRLVGVEPWNPNGGGARTGVVKMWMPNKGIGFIVDNETGQDVFCHHSDIGGRSLSKGGNVTFDMGENPGGGPGATHKAVNVSGAVGPRVDTREGKGDGFGKGGAGRGGAVAGIVPMGADGLPPVAMPMDGTEPPTVGAYSPYGAVGVVTAIAAPGSRPVPVRVSGPMQTRADVNVHVPLGWRPGTKVRFMLLDQEFEVDVPFGTQPGSTFSVDM